MPMEGCPVGTVAWVPVMVMATPCASGCMTPTPIMSGKLTPSNCMTGAMTPVLMSGQMTPMMPGQMSPNVSTRAAQRSSGKNASPPGRWSSTTSSTVAPSGECSDVVSLDGSDAEEEDSAEVCAELISHLEGGGVEREAAIDALLGNVPELAFDAAACRVVQTALTCASEEVAVSLAAEMKGRVVEAIRSPHANHVIQKILDALPAASTIFIAEEVTGSAAELARHRYGCRVLGRLVECHAQSEAAEALMEEVLSEAAELSRHTFSHYVIEAVLQHGSAEQTARVAEHMCLDLLRNAKHRSATYVVERALTHCSTKHRRRLISGLLGSVTSALSLVENQFGCHVAKGVLRLPREDLEHVLPHLQEATPQLQLTKYGRRVVAELNQRFS